MTRIILAALVALVVSGTVLVEDGQAQELPSKEFLENFDSVKHGRVHCIA